MRLLFSCFSDLVDDQQQSVVPCFYETIIKSLEKQGNEVMVFISKRWGIDYIGECPEQIKTIISNFNPDICFLFNNTFYDLSKIVDCDIVVYEVDSPLYYSNKKQLKDHINRYKFFVSQKSSIDMLVSEYKADINNILKIPFFTEIKHDPQHKLSNNIAFIGTKFDNHNYINNYVKKVGSKYGRHILLNYIKEFNKNPYNSKKNILKLINCEDPYISSLINNNELIEVLSDYKRVKTLSAIADLGLDLYGTSSWETDSYNEPYLILNYIRANVYSLEQNQSIYNSVKIGININHMQAKEGFSWRVADILASNACLVTEPTQNMIKMFDGIDIPYFTNPYEARSICIDLINNETKRQDIVAKSHELIEKKFRFKYVLDKIEDFLKISLKGTSSKKTLYYVVDDYVNKELLETSNCKGKIVDHFSCNSENDFTIENFPDIKFIYTLGQPISFVDYDEASCYMVDGFSCLENNYVWTDKRKAIFKVILKNKIKNSLLLTLKYFTYKNHQQVIIFVNGNKIADYLATDEQSKSIIIHKHSVEDTNTLTFEFYFPEACSPASLDENEDQRILALAFKEIMISQYLPKSPWIIHLIH